MSSIQHQNLTSFHRKLLVNENTAVHCYPGDTISGKSANVSHIAELADSWSEIYVCHVVFSRVVALPRECKCVCVPVNSFITALGSHSSVLQLKSPQSRQIPAIQRHFIQLNIITGEKKKEQSHPPNKSEELMQCAL